MEHSPLAYTIADACRLVGIGVTKIYKEIGAGKIEARHAGKRTLIPAASLQAYVDNLPRANITTGQSQR